MKLSKEQLRAIFEMMETSIDGDDSFEGTITYTAMEPWLKPGEFEVTGTIRVGNSMGQGGVSIMEPSEEMKASRQQQG